VGKDIVYFRQQAERCRRLAAGCSDVKTSQSLRLMAEDYAARIAQTEESEPVEVMVITPRQG
jgi:hypothetical protein